MRKLIWCGCAALVVGAVCMYGVAQWAQTHPESTGACCARVAWRVATEWNPVVQVGRVMGSKMVALIQSKPPQPPAAPAAPPACPADPGISPPSPITEVIDLANVPTPGRWLDRAPQVMPPSPDFPLERELAAMQQPQVETVPPGAIEEAEQPVPAEMPPADGDTPDAKPTDVDYWINRLEGETDVEKLPMPRVEDAEGEDVYQIQLETPARCPRSCTEPTAETLPMPRESEPQVIINEEEERLSTNVDVPGKPCGEECEPATELLPLPHEDASEADYKEFLQGLLKDVEKPDGSFEETEPSQPTPVPDCREDPNMYQRYPGCPSGSCPGLAKPATMDTCPASTKPME